MPRLASIFLCIFLFKLSAAQTKVLEYDFNTNLGPSIEDGAIGSGVVPGLGGSVWNEPNVMAFQIFNVQQCFNDSAASDAYFAMILTPTSSSVNISTITFAAGRVSAEAQVAIEIR